MEHCEGFELTDTGRAHLAATGPRGGCADWVRADVRHRFACEVRAIAIFERNRRNRLGRIARSIVPPAA